MFKDIMKIFKKFVFILFLLFIYISICAFSYANTISQNIENSVFRLHVIANSNTEEDQNLKYLVRDRILEYINSVSQNNISKKEIINTVTYNIEEIKKIAEQVISENGYSYPVKVSIGNFSFPSKQYGDISFPAGFYDALKIEIGNAEGKNWWCVMFPPLCFVDVTSGIVPEESKEILKKSLSSEEYEIISENSDNINFKFKIIEMFQSLNIKIAKQ